MKNDYIQNLEKWKSLVKNINTLIVGIDVSKDKHDACFGTRDSIFIKKFAFQNSFNSFEDLNKKIKDLICEKKSSNVIIGLEPTGVYWRPIYDYLISKKFTICLVDPLTVFHNRKTNHQDKGKSDKKDAAAILDLIGQSKFHFAVNGTKRHFYQRITLRCWKNAQKTLIQYKNRTSSNLSLFFPEFEKLVSDISSTKSRNFLLMFPTKKSITSLTEKEFIKKSKAELKRFSIENLKELYDAAKNSIGININEKEERVFMLNSIEQLSSAIEKDNIWFNRCHDLVKNDLEYLKLRKIKGLGPKIVTGILLSIGDYDAFSNAKQITKLAGLNLIDKTSGSSVNCPAHISHHGNYELRYWAFSGAMQVIKYNVNFKKFYERKTKGKKGNGIRKKGLIAVSDKLLRTIWAILHKGEEYNPIHK